MAIFKLTHGDIELIIRGSCLSCARSVAADNAGTEGPHVWRNPELSQIVLIRETGFPELISRGSKNDKDDAA